MQDQQVTQPTSSYPTTETVGFPPQSAPAPRRNILKWILIFLIGVLVIGGAAFFVLQSNSTSDSLASPTPAVQGIDFIQTPAPTVQATPTAEPLDRAEISVEILNGTGIPGEAAYVESQLKALGYSEFKTGNATGPTVKVTSITFNSSLSQSAVTEITQKLESLFETVETKSSTTTGSFDVRIVVGLRKGATPKSAATTSGTATPKTSSSPKPLANPTVTAKPSPTSLPLSN